MTDYFDDDYKHYKEMDEDLSLNDLRIRNMFRNELEPIIERIRDLESLIQTCWDAIEQIRSKECETEKR